MKKIITYLLIFWLLPYVGNSQSIVWERSIDVSTIIMTGGEDRVADIAIYDTLTSFCSSTCGRFGGNSISGSSFYNPVVFKLNSNGIIQDTFIISDSILFSHRIALNRRRQHIWVAYRTSIVPYTRMVIEKLNFQGFTIVRRDFQGLERIDSIPASIYKLLPYIDAVSICL